MDLFVYGTLKFKELRCRIIGREVLTESALLTGYKAVHCRVFFRILPYPCLVECSGNVVTGILLKDLSRSEMGLLDKYEGKFYNRRQIIVRTATGNKKVWCYYVKNKKRITEIRWKK